MLYVVQVSDQYLLDMALHAKEVGAMTVNVDLISGDSDSNYLSKKMKEWCLGKLNLNQKHKFLSLCSPQKTFRLTIPVRRIV